MQTASASPNSGKAVTHFAFTNAGDHPVKITGASTTCGCTAAVAEKRAYAPGERGQIDVSFKTINRHGLYGEPITVKTDDGAETVLNFRVFVHDVIDLQPELIFWRENEPLTPKIISVKVTDGFNVKQIEASSSTPDVEVRVETVAAGREYRLVITPKVARTRAHVSVKPAYSAPEPKVFTAFVRVG